MDNFSYQIQGIELEEFCSRYDADKLISTYIRDIISELIDRKFIQKLSIQGVDYVNTPGVDGTVVISQESTSDEFPKGKSL